MRAIITNRISLILLLVLVCNICSGCVKDRMSVQDSQVWFNEHSELLKSMNEILLDHPSIYRVDPGMRVEVVAKFEEFASQTESAYHRLSELCQENGIIGIAVARTGGKKEGDLISISFTLESIGIGSSGGSSLSVERIFQGSILSTFSEDEYIIVSTDQKGWYIVFYTDKI